MAIVFEGQKVSSATLSLLKQEIEKSQLKPHLTILVVGEDSASKIYIEKKVQAGEAIGVVVEVLRFSEEIKDFELVRQIQTLNESKEVKGIIVQLPLPKFLDKDKIIRSIDPKKDVDALSRSSPFKGATPLAVLEILKEGRISLKGKHAVIVGSSDLVGKPLALLFLEKDTTVTVCHINTVGLSYFTKQADILVSAAGSPHLIKEDMVKKDAVVVDVGITRQKDKLLGDVDFENVSKIASFITPVPGGVGPMTVAMLMRNLVEASRD